MNWLDRLLAPLQERIGEMAFAWLMIFVGFLIALPMSYGMALLHEPRAFWVWHDILGVI